MRKIKFKAKRLNDQEWVYGYFYKPVGGINLVHT